MNLIAASIVFLLALFCCPGPALAENSEAPSSVDEYVLGRDLYLSLTIDNMPAAVEHLQRAIDIDPTNLRAWYTLSDAYRTGMLMVKTDQEEWRNESRRVADHILTLSRDSESAAGHEPGILADFATRLRGRAAIDLGKWSEAEEILHRKTVLESDSELNKGLDISYGTFLFSVGRIRDAAHFLERAHKADRYSAVVYSHLSRIYASMNDYERSLEILDEGMNLFAHSATDIEQRWHPLLRRTALLTALATGDKALIATRAGSINDGDLGVGALDKQLASQLDDTQALLRTLHKMWSDPVNQHGYRAESIAIWAAYAGDHDLATTALHSLPNELATWALWHPAMTGIRNTSGFQEIIEKNGLLKYWITSGKWGDFCRPAGAQGFRCEAGSE